MTDVNSWNNAGQKPPKKQKRPKTKQTKIYNKN